MTALLKTIAAVLLFIFCDTIKPAEFRALSTQVIKASETLDVDTSGMMVDYGGQLVNKRQSLFCTHWNLIGKEVTFIARNGEKVTRVVVGQNRLGYDLCMLTFNEDLDPKQHWIAPVADIEGDTTVTIFRYKERAPISVKVSSDYFMHGPISAEYNSFECIPGKSVRPGDSGKGWYAMVDGKIHLVGINSYIQINMFTQEPIRAFSPEVGEIYNPKHWTLGE
jgi:hypothetical protein